MGSLSLDFGGFKSVLLHFRDLIDPRWKFVRLFCSLLVELGSFCSIPK